MFIRWLTYQFQCLGREMTHQIHSHNLRQRRRGRRWRGERERERERDENWREGGWERREGGRGEERGREGTEVKQLDYQLTNGQLSNPSRQSIHNLINLHSWTPGSNQDF